MTPETFERLLIRHEGIRLKPYRDTVGKLTIGVGRNLDDNGITQDEALMLLRNDIERHAEELEAEFPIVNELTKIRYYVLLDMAFNIGVPRLKGFKKMWSAIEAGDFEEAAVEMLDSKWATQVGHRSTELSLLMKKG